MTFSLNVVWVVCRLNLFSLNPIELSFPLCHIWTEFISKIGLIVYCRQRLLSVSTRTRPVWTVVAFSPAATIRYHFCLVFFLLCWCLTISIGFGNGYQMHSHIELCSIFHHNISTLLLSPKFVCSNHFWCVHYLHWIAIVFDATPLYTNYVQVN